MNARAYFSILRPIRTLLFAGFYGWGFGVTLLSTIGRAPWPETIFLSIAVLGSWILGSLMLGPAHELMSRSFFMSLPGARRSIRRWHLRTVIVGSVLLFVGTEFSRLVYPRPATLGLILLGLTLPLLNRREPTPRAFYLKVVFMLSLSVLLGSPLRSHLLEAGRQFPWFVLLFGVGGAWMNFRLGFSEQSVRARSQFRQVIYCAQSLAPGFGWYQMIRYVQTENARVISSMRTQKQSRNWNVTTVGTSFRDWLAVVHHARWGSAHLLFTQHLLFVLMGVLPPMIVGVMSIGFPYLSNQKVSVTDLAGQIADAGRLELPATQAAEFFYTMCPVFGMVTAVLACVVIGGPSIRLPLSRSRLATCVSFESLRFTALTFAGYTVGILGIALLSSAIACRPFEFERFGQPLVCIMIIPPFAFVLLTILFLTARIRWIPPLGALGFCLLAGIGAIVIAHHHAEKFLALPGVLSWGIFTGLSISACWTALRHFYANCDLNQPSPWSRNMTAGN